MTFAEYWARKVRANPPLDQETTQVRLSAESFRRELEKAYSAGRDSLPPAPPQDSPDIFDDMFRTFNTFS